MTRPAKLWTISAVTLLVFMLLGWLIPALMGLDGGSRWILRGAIWFLGLLAALIVFVWLRAKWRGLPPEDPKQGDEIDVAFAAARTRLVGAKGARIGRMPVILLAGPPGSAKTTIVTRSGLEPEHIAGEVYRGDAIVATQSVNLWLAQDNVVLEAGGKLVGDAARWKRMVRWIQPNRLGAAFSRGRQAPRVAVVCFGCDELLKPGANEAVPAAAQKLRARLAEMAQQIGIRLPVYVIFTKSDRLPYFEDFVRSFSRDEAKDVLGVTLTVPQAGAVGGYAERESRRLGDAFAVLFRGLAARRLDVLPRESAEEVRAGAYEFPREFRKITDLATQFLLDLCRPSQLGVSPFLRGFYFTGVRATFVHDVGAEPQRAEHSSAQAMDATGVFDARMLHQVQASPVQQQAGSRKVAEWTFLERVFRDVVLKDEVARGVTAGGTKVNLLRRALVGAVGVASIVFAVGFITSFFSNRSLLGNTRTTVESARGLASAGAVPDIQTLERLDTLRSLAERLDRYDRDGPPLGLDWFLYAGDGVQPHVRQLYFHRFGDLLWARARGGLRSYLGGLPPRPDSSSEYDRTRDALRAYIITTTRPDQSSRDFLSPALLAYWRSGLGADDRTVSLADAQFGFFADELPHGNPYEGQADTALVSRTQRFLGEFAGAAQLYSVLLAQASNDGAPIRWNDATVRNETVVPAAFTAEGWTRAQAALANVPSLFDSEDWVVGEARVDVADRARLEQTLRERYTADYIASWLGFIRAARVASYGSLQDASRKLALLSANQSPLLGMLQLVADNTNVDSTTSIGRAFKPVHELVPPQGTSVSESAGRYLNGLGALQSTLDQVVSAVGPVRTQAMVQSNTNAQQVRTEISSIARGFSTEGDARAVGAAVTGFLQAPITSAEFVLGALPAAEINAKGGEFCRPFSPLNGRFPFSARSNTDATLDDIAAVFRPGDGALWTFYDAELRDLLTRQGSNFAGSSGAATQASPAFVAFFNRAAGVSRAFFDDNGDGPSVLFTLRAQTSAQIPQVVVNIEGRREVFTQTQAATRPFEWRGTATGASIIVRLGNQDVLVAETPPGPWSTFRLFHQATFQRSGAGWLVTWRVPGQSATVSADLSFAKGEPIFQSDYFSRLGTCPTRIVR